MTTITITLNERGPDREDIIKKLSAVLAGDLQIEGEVLTATIDFNGEIEDLLK